MDAEELKSSAARMSLFAAIFLTSFKLAIGLYTNSLAILSEALHSGLDLLATLMTWFAIRISLRPADRNHPYGHGKVENISALGETLLLLVVCVYVGWEGTHRLLAHDASVKPSLWGVGIMAISMGIDLWRVRQLRAAARHTNSQALEADALHFASDILSSGVVLLGTAIIWATDYFHIGGPARPYLLQADTIAAIVVACVILHACLQMALQAINFLMDAGGAEHQEEIEKAVLAVRGVREIRRLRMRTSGPDNFVDLAIGVDPGMRVSDGHRICSDVEHVIAGILGRADVTVHLEPCADRGHDASKSPIETVRRVALHEGIDLQDILVLTRPDGRLQIELVAKFDGANTYADAYSRTKKLIRKAAEEIPDAIFTSHIEPLSESVSIQTYSPENNALARSIWKQVQEVFECHPLVSHPHGFQCFVQPHLGLSVSYHICMGEHLTVRQVHIETINIEREIQTIIPTLGHIQTHVEPFHPGQNADEARAEAAEKEAVAKAEAEERARREAAQAEAGAQPASAPEAESGTDAKNESPVRQ